MLLPSPDPHVPLACLPLSPTAQRVPSGLATAMSNVAHFSPWSTNSDVKSLFIAPETNIPTVVDLHPRTLDQYLPDKVNRGLNEATVTDLEHKRAP